jgi:hypothetical protein
MKYIPLDDLNTTQEIDDGLYRIATKDTGVEEPKAELFTEGDLYRAREGAPAGADSIAFDDDWKYWNSETGEFLGYVFRD